MLKPIAVGYKSFGDSSGLNWWLFRLPADLVDLKEFCEVNDIVRYSGQPGQPYAGSPSVRHSNTLALLTQSCGLDV